ncbi:hypothetical protein JFN88_08690 [Paenibacillus sp. MAHUQ-46]|uniref:Uncharacterized protein n=1 Tax=Paenibacillus roseus TaxID=2798579 RepID=A0A934IY35_9BACL|nr:hypothetical protein [Paenibacillus roseus]MBJ6361381.1 hypothetical protein [Paenibacillus roseus]
MGREPVRGVIFSEWFPNSGYEHSGGAELECYDERCWRNRERVAGDGHLHSDQAQAVEDQP